MQRFKQNLLRASILTLLGTTGVLITPTQAAAQTPKTGSAEKKADDPTPVSIVAPLPLPVTGSLAIGGTVSVRDVDKTVRTPFQEQLTTNVNDRSFTVAPGHRLTIEFVTSRCEIQANVAQTNNATTFFLNTTVGARTLPHYFQPRSITTFQGAGSITTFFGSNDMTRIYADPGTTVSMLGFRDNYFCVVTVSGYTVPI